MKLVLLDPYQIKEFPKASYCKNEEINVALTEQIDKFYYEFLRPYFLKSSAIPTFNPVQKIEFLLNKTQKDILYWSGQLTKHLIVSKAAYDIMKEYVISPHIAFDKIILRNANETRTDYYYLHFYKSMWDDVDLKKSEFVYVDDRRNPTYEIKADYDNKQDFIQERNFGVKSKERKFAVAKKVVIPDISSYDLFAFFVYSDQYFYMSPRLFQRLKKEGIKFSGEGLDVDWLEDVKKDTSKKMKLAYLDPNELSTYSKASYIKNEKKHENLILRMDRFYMQYLRPYFRSSTPIPDFNPLEEVEFLLTKRPKDIYHFNSDLVKHLIVSKAAYDIMKEYVISPHVAFDKIILRNANETRTDYYYLHFYKSMWDDVDLEKSEFFYVDDKCNPTFDMKASYVNKQDVIEEVCTGIQLQSGKFKSVYTKKITIPDISSYDLFALFTFSDQSFYLSPRLFQRLKKEGVKFGGEVVEIDWLEDLHEDTYEESNLATTTPSEEDSNVPLTTEDINIIYTPLVEKIEEYKDYFDKASHIDEFITDIAQWRNAPMMEQEGGSTAFKKTPEDKKNDYYDQLLAKAQSSETTYKINAILDWIEHIDDHVDQEAILNTLVTTLNAVNDYIPKLSIKVDTILISVADDGKVEYAAYEEGNLSASTEYYIEDLEELKAYEIRPDGLLEPYFKILTDLDFDDLESSFEEVPFLVNLYGYLYHRFV